MPKVKISDFNSNPALNTDIDSINLAEGCAPSGINDAIRELMSQLKDWQSGTSNDPMVIGSSGSLTLNQGTANGVAYLNGSKVVTSGSALTFDGTNLGVTGNTSTTVQASSRNDNTTTNAGAKLATLYTSTEITSLGHYWDGSQFLGKVNSLSDLLFTRNNSEQMRLTSTGLGIGTSSPSYKLDVYGSGTPVAAVRSSSSGDAKLYLECAGTNSGYVAYNRSLQALTFSANNSTNHAILDSSGNLGLGVTPSAWASSYKAFQIGASSAFYAHGGVTSMHVTNNSYEDSGGVKYKVTGAAADYQQSGGVHYWYTAASGTAGNAITFTQAATLGSDGNFLLGTTTTASFRLIASFLSSSGNGGIKLIDSQSNNTAAFINFSNGSGTLGSITNNGNGAVLYNLTSDQRLKQNIQDAESASTLIDSLQVRQYEWKSNGSHQRYGFIAQELYLVAPEAVYKPNDENEMMAVDYSKLVPMLIKEVQELRHRVATLEAQ